MNDLGLIEHFREDVAAPDGERAAAARARLMAEVRARPDVEIEPTARNRRRVDQSRQRSSRVALRFGLGAAAVIAAASAIVFFSGGGGSTSNADAAIIRHAAAAFAAPPNEIFHYRLQGGGLVAEWWQLTSAPYSFLAGKGQVGSMSYVSDDGTTFSHYDPATNTIEQSPSIKPPDDRKRGLLSEIEQDLQDGRARVLGTVTTDGTPTYEVQLADNNGFDAQSLIAYVDQTNYQPIEIADPQSNGTTFNLRVVAFEYLPATSANENLLSLTARYPSAQVINTTPPSTTNPVTTPAAATTATTAG
jgi:hypothetical protein